MTNHPRRASRRDRKDRQRMARHVSVWVDANTDAALTPWQRDLLERTAMSHRGAARVNPHRDHRHVPIAVGVDIAKDGDDTVTVATMTASGQMYVAPLGTDPADPYAWRSVGWTNDPLDLRALIADTDDDVKAIASLSNHASRSITVTAPLRSSFHVYRSLDDNVTGREWPDDGLHPASLLGWSQTVEGLDADLMPLVVCDHCGEPVPCIEKVLRHMDTDGHRCFCRPTGTCTVTGRPVAELPTR